MNPNRSASRTENAKPNALTSQNQRKNVSTIEPLHSVKAVNKLGQCNDCRVIWLNPVRCRQKTMANNVAARTHLNHIQCRRQPAASFFLDSVTTPSASKSTFSVTYRIIWVSG